MMDLSGITLPDRLRPASEDDVPDLLRLINALADYERDPDAVANTEDKLRTWIFGADAVASALVAEVDGRVVGIAIYYRSYSTWTGVPGLYLEDLFVEEEHRGSGLGKAFFVALASIAEARGYERLEWVVLDWNSSAIAFYDGLGGRPMKGWSTYRLTGERLRDLAVADG